MRRAAGSPVEENGSAFLFLCEQPRTLTLPIRVSGQHKIWPLEPAIAAAARATLRPADASWDARRPTDGTQPQAAAAAASSQSVPPGL